MNMVGEVFLLGQRKDKYIHSRAGSEKRLMDMNPKKTRPNKDHERKRKI